MVNNCKGLTVTAMLMSIAIMNLACLENDGHLASSAGDDSTMNTPVDSKLAEERINRLRAIVPQKPTVIGNLAVVKTMREATETKRAEALNLLIDCLAFNYDPDNSNESRDQSEMIPAIGAINDYFGESASESLYKRGMSTEKDWLADRIALTVRTNLLEPTREEFARRYLADLTNHRAVYFSTVLARNTLQVKLARRQEGFDEIEKIIEKNQNQHGKPDASP